MPADKTQLHLDYAALTDRGQQRPHNEDSVFAGPILAKAGGQTTDWVLLVVADGVGGYEAGAWASSTAIAVLSRELPGHLSKRDPAEALRRACLATNALLRREVSRKNLSSGTTLVAALLGSGELYWSNVGDSRAYLVTGGIAQQLSEDHSWVQEQVRAGNMTPEDAHSSDQRNVITRGVGLRDEIDFDCGGPTALGAASAVVLCSDGLHSVVSDDEIASYVTAASPAKAARQLVDLANERGGPDNISVVICSAQADQAEGDEPPSPPEPANKGASSLVLATVAAGLVLLGAALLSVLYRGA